MQLTARSSLIPLNLKTSFIDFNWAVWPAVVRPAINNCQLDILLSLSAKKCIKRNECVMLAISHWHYELTNWWHVIDQMDILMQTKRNIFEILTTEITVWISNLFGWMLCFSFFFVQISEGSYITLWIWKYRNFWVLHIYRVFLYWGDKSVLVRIL